MFRRAGENITALTLPSITGTELHVPWSRRFSFFFFHLDQILSREASTNLVARAVFSFKGTTCKCQNILRQFPFFSTQSRYSTNTIIAISDSGSDIGYYGTTLVNRPPVKTLTCATHCEQRIHIHRKILGPNFRTKRLVSLETVVPGIRYN